MTDSLHSHCVGGKLLDKYGTVEPSRVTCPRDTTSVLERERSQPYLTSTSSRADLYKTDLTLASERKREAGLRKAESKTAVTKQLSEDRIQNSLGLPAEFKPGSLTTHTTSRIHSCRYI